MKAAWGNEFRKTRISCLSPSARNGEVRTRGKALQIHLASSRKYLVKSDVKRGGDEPRGVGEENIQNLRRKGNISSS